MGVCVVVSSSGGLVRKNTNLSSLVTSLMNFAGAAHEKALACVISAEEHSPHVRISYFSASSFLEDIDIRLKNPGNPWLQD